MLDPAVSRAVDVAVSMRFRDGIGRGLDELYGNRDVLIAAEWLGSMLSIRAEGSLPESERVRLSDCGAVIETGAELLLFSRTFRRGDEPLRLLSEDPELWLPELEWGEGDGHSALVGEPLARACADFVDGANATASLEPAEAAALLGRAAVVGITEAGGALVVELRSDEPLVGDGRAIVRFPLEADAAPSSGASPASSQPFGAWQEHDTLAWTASCGETSYSWAPGPGAAPVLQIDDHEWVLQDSWAQQAHPAIFDGAVSERPPT